MKSQILKGELKSVLKNVNDTLSELDFAVHELFEKYEILNEDMTNQMIVSEEEFNQLKKEMETLESNLKICSGEKKELLSELKYKNDMINNLENSLKSCLENKNLNGTPVVSTTNGGDTNSNCQSETREQIIKAIMPSIASRSAVGKHWGSNERKTALEQLKKLTVNAKELIIIDPYFYKGGYSDEENEEYISNIKDIIDPSKIERLHIIYDKRHTAALIRDEINNLYGNKITEASTNKIHDRIWIIDQNNASLVGTSLNGLGSKLAFILPLPYKDLESLKTELKNYKLLYDKEKKKRMRLDSLSLDEFINRASNSSVISRFLIGE
jgi:hypothetical protein